MASKLYGKEVDMEGNRLPLRNQPGAAAPKPQEMQSFHLGGQQGWEKKDVHSQGHIGSTAGETARERER